MVVNTEKCIGCGQCVPYCPARAISVQNGKAVIDWDGCLECGNCKFAGICPKDALVQQTLVMPRLMRAIFSNVRETSPNTGVPGRGTEEMKTNEITGRFPVGKIGIACEMGRPSTGTSFLDVEKIAKIVVAHGAVLETENPTAVIFEPDRPGIIKEEFRNERALSVIIEGLIEPEQLPGLLLDLKQAQGKIDTVFSIDIITPMVDGKIPADALLAQVGLSRRPNGKTCVGLGRAD